MSVEVISNGENACLYCSTTMMAFGPVFYENEDPKNFLAWLSPLDPRVLAANEFSSRVAEWRQRHHELEEYGNAGFVDTGFVDRLYIEPADTYPEEEPRIQCAFFHGVALSEDQCFDLQTKRPDLVRAAWEKAQEDVYDNQ